MNKKLSAEALEHWVNITRGSLADRGSPTYGDKGLAEAFAEVLAQINNACIVGFPCERHGGAVHGGEAEELRAGIEQLLRRFSYVDVDASLVLAELRKALFALLDRVDARDSLAFRETTDGVVATGKDENV